MYTMSEAAWNHLLKQMLDNKSNIDSDGYLKVDQSYKSSKAKTTKVTLVSPVQQGVVQAKAKRASRLKDSLSK